MLIAVVNKSDESPARPLLGGNKFLILGRETHRAIAISKIDAARMRTSKTCAAGPVRHGEAASGTRMSSRLTTGDLFAIFLANAMPLSSNAFSSHALE